MLSHNADIAAIFAKIADPLEIEQTNPFRMRAYRNVARTGDNDGLHDVSTQFAAAQP